MEILESIVEVTAQRDRESLEISLVMALAEITPASTIRLLNVRQQEEATVLKVCVDYDVPQHSLRETGKREIGLEDDPQLQQVFEQKQACFFPGQARYIFPVINEAEHVLALLELTDTQPERLDQTTLAIFLKIYRNYLRLIEESTRDTLTGLLNRKTFDTCLHQILQQQKLEAMQAHLGQERRHDSGEHHWLAVADIDHFKRINDNFGHLFGDEVLVLITRIMCETLRSTDKLFRFGGEEFIILLTAENAAGATTAFERFRSRVAEYPFPQLDQVTISLGFVKVGPQDVPATVVGHADQALYYAKEHGRNQVCSYDELVATGKIVPETDSRDTDVELF